MIFGEARLARGEGELRGTAAGEAQQRAAILLDGADARAAEGKGAVEVVERAGVGEFAAHAQAEADGMQAAVERGVVLQLKAVACVGRIAERCAPAVKGPQYLDGGAGGARAARRGEAEKLETRFVDGPGVDDPGIGELGGVGGAASFQATFRQVEAADAGVVDAGFQKRVTRGERVALAELPIGAR